jgi:hypothetical protein
MVELLLSVRDFIVALMLGMAGVEASEASSQNHSVDGSPSISASDIEPRDARAVDAPGSAAPQPGPPTKRPSTPPRLRFVIAPFG